MKIVSLIFLLLLAGQSFASTGGKLEMEVEDRIRFKEALVLYDEIHQAFFTSDMKLAQKKSLALAKKLDGFMDDSVQKLFKFSIENASSMEFIGKRDDNNRRLDYISKAFAYVLKKYNVTDKYGIYFCPMVKKTWLQNITKSEDVRNPYASDMPNCGEKK